MAFYTRRQLILLLALLAAAAAGLGVRHWRAAYPELAAQLEQFDREAPAQEAAAPSRPSARDHAPRPLGKAGGAAAKLPRQPIDVNRATADELVHLPGVGPALATRIIAAREAEGRFESIDDLRKVKGLGRTRLERLRALLTVTD